MDCAEGRAAVACKHRPIVSVVCLLARGLAMLITAGGAARHGSAARTDSPPTLATKSSRSLPRQLQRFWGLGI